MRHDFHLKGGCSAAQDSQRGYIVLSRPGGHVYCLGPWGTISERGWEDQELADGTRTMTKQAQKDKER